MLVQQYHTGGVVTKQKLLELHDVPSNFQFVPSVSFGREHGHGVEGRIWRRSVGPPLESGVPSRSPGLQMTGVSRRGRPRGLLLSPLAPASLNFKDSFRATGSPAGKMRTFRARRILVSRAWLGRQRGERARRPPGGSGTTGDNGDHEAGVGRSERPPSSPSPSPSGSDSATL